MSGIAVDAVLWWALVQFPSPGFIIGLMIMAALLCWSHAILLPKLVWLRRAPGWDTLGTVTVGATIAALAVVIGFAAGLAAGIANLLVLTALVFLGSHLVNVDASVTLLAQRLSVDSQTLTLIVVATPGLLAGGAVASGIAAALALNLPASLIVVSPKAALLGGAAGPVILMASLYDRETNLGGLLAMVGAGVVASLATAPRWRSPWPPASTRWALTAGALALVAVQGLTIRVRHDVSSRPLQAARELRCPAQMTPDCLADAARVLGAARPRPWLMFGTQEPLRARFTVEQAEIEAAVAPVALAARERPALAADLAPLERLSSAAAISKGLTALADNLSGLAGSSSFGSLQVRHLLHGRMDGIPTLHAVAERWRSLLPSLPPFERRMADVRLARLLADLGERDAAAQVLAPLRSDANVSALDWFAAGDGAQALLSGARRGQGELADVANAAVGLLRRQGGPGAGFPGADFWTQFRDTFPARLAAMTPGQYNEGRWPDIRALISTLWRLGDTAHAREFADAVADQARQLGTEAGYALAAAIYMDIGEAGPAAASLAAGVAALPPDALTCPKATPPGLDWRACALKDPARQFERLPLVVQSYRLGGQPPEPSLMLDGKHFLPALIRERLTAGLPTGWLDSRLDRTPAIDSMLLRAAFDCWADEDLRETRLLLALLAKRLPSSGIPPQSAFVAEPAFVLAAALGDDGLQLAFARSFLTDVHINAARDYAADVAEAAAFWRGNLSDDLMARAMQ